MRIPTMRGIGALALAGAASTALVLVSVLAALAVVGVIVGQVYNIRLATINAKLLPL